MIQQRTEIEAQRSSLLKAHATIEGLTEETRVLSYRISFLEGEKESLEVRVRDEEGGRVRAQEELCAASRALEAQVEAKGAAQRALEGLRAQVHDQEGKRDQEHVSGRKIPRGYPPYREVIHHTARLSTIRHQPPPVVPINPYSLLPSLYSRQSIN